MKLLLFLVGLWLAVASSNAWFMTREKKPASAEMDQGCIDLARAGSCDMYDCMKERHQCEILTEDAKPMCVDMESKRDRFDHQGKQWLNATRPCLHAALIKEYEKTEHNCDDLTDAIKQASSNCALSVTPNICKIFTANTAVLVESQNARLSDSSGVLRQCGWTVLRAYMAYSTGGK